MLSLEIGATGMLAQQTNVEVISNNIANMTTAGYKRQRAGFQDLIYQNKIQPGSQGSDNGNTIPSGMQIGVGVRTASVYRIHEQGGLQLTENDLDLGISGEGYFQVQLPNGDTAYTRDGALQLNENGEIVTSQGYLLEPNITVPVDAIRIQVNESGEVFVKIDGTVDLQNQGQLQLASFVNPGGLEAIGNNLFTETTSSGTATTGNPGSEHYGKINQGFIENSNVNIVEEITNLITAQRAYEMNSKVISTTDEMMGTTSQLR